MKSPEEAKMQRAHSLAGQLERPGNSFMQESHQNAQQSSPFVDTNSVRRGGKATSVHRMNQQSTLLYNDDERRTGPTGSQLHRPGVTGDNSVRLGLGNVVAENSEDVNVDDAESSYLGQYSINATEVKKNLRGQRFPGIPFQGNLPLSNNDMVMHLNRREAVLESPTMSRYSEPAIQQNHSSYAPQTMHAHPANVMHPHHGHHPHLYPSFENQLQNGAFSTAMGGARIHAPHSMGMQTYDLYERDAVQRDDLLNLSENDSPQQYRSYRMTSPFNENRASISRGPGAPSVLKAVPPRNEHVYSRYDHLKLADADSDDDRSSPAKADHARAGCKEDGIEDLDDVQEKDEAFVNSQGNRAKTLNQQDQRRQFIEKARLLASTGDKERVVVTPKSRSIDKRSAFQQSDQQVTTSYHENEAAAGPQGEAISPDEDKQGAGSEQNTRNFSTSQRLLASGSALPLINDGERSPSNEQRQRELSGTPQTTKQGTTTHREDTQTERGLLQSGMKTSRAGACSSSDRQLSYSRRVEQQRAETRGEAQQMMPGLKATPQCAKYAAERQSERQNSRMSIRREQQNIHHQRENSSSSNDNDMAGNFQQSQQRSLHKHTTSGVGTKRDRSQRRSAQQIVPVNGSEGGSAYRTRAFPLSHGFGAADGQAAPSDNIRNPTRLETNSSQQSVYLDASNQPHQAHIQEVQRRRRHQQQNQRSPTMEQATSAVENHPVVVSGGTTTSRKRTKPARQQQQQQQPQQLPPRFFAAWQQPFMPPQPTAPTDQHFYPNPHHAVPPPHFAASLPMTPHFYRSPAGQHPALKHHMGHPAMYPQHFYHPHAGHPHHPGHVHPGHHHPGHHPGHLAHQGHPHYGIAPHQSWQEENAPEHTYPYYPHHPAMFPGHHPQAAHHHPAHAQMFPYQHGYPMHHQPFAGQHPLMPPGVGYNHPYYQDRHGAWGGAHHDNVGSCSPDSKVDEKSESCSAISEHVQQAESRNQQPDSNRPIQRQNRDQARRQEHQQQQGRNSRALNGEPGGARFNHVDAAYHQNNRRSSQKQEGYVDNEEDIEEEGSYRSYPNGALQGIQGSYTPSENSQRQRAHQTFQQLPSQTRRDQKIAEKFTARMNRSLQQHEAGHHQHANAHLSASAQQSSVKRHMVEQLQRSAQLTGEDEALLESVLPPSLSPAPRSCAEILTSNHKSDVNMLTNAPQAVKSKPLQNRPVLRQMEASLSGGAEILKRPHKGEQITYESDFRETPGSLFGRKLQEQQPQQQMQPRSSRYAQAAVIEDLIGKSPDGDEDFEIDQDQRLPSRKLDNRGRKLLDASRQNGEHVSQESKSPGAGLLTPANIHAGNNEDGGGIYERNSLLQSSDNLSGIKLQENPTAHLASSSQHSFPAQDVTPSLYESQQNQQIAQSKMLDRTLVHDFDEDVQISINKKNEDSSEQASSQAQLQRSSSDGQQSASQKQFQAPQVTRQHTSSSKNHSVIPQLQDMPSSQMLGGGDSINFAADTDEQAIRSQTGQGVTKGMRKVQSERVGNKDNVQTERSIAESTPQQQHSINSSQTFAFKKTSSQNEQQNQKQQNKRFLMPYNQEGMPQSYGGSSEDDSKASHHVVAGNQKQTTLTDAQIKDLYSKVKNPGVQQILQDTAKCKIEENTISPSLPVIPVPQPFSANNTASYKPCNCRRTGCFKLYCDCLRAGLLCSSQCKCQGCRNREPNEQRERLLNLVKAKVDFSSPSKKNVGQGTSLTPTRGCHCKKSSCLKNYCECFQNGQPCSGRCACIDCKNTNMSYLIGRSKRESSTPSSNSSSPAKKTNQSKYQFAALVQNVSIDYEDQTNGRSLADTVKYRLENGGAQQIKSDVSAINSSAMHKRPLVPEAGVGKAKGLKEASTVVTKKKPSGETLDYRAQEDKDGQRGVIGGEVTKMGIAIDQSSVQYGDEEDISEISTPVMALATQDRSQQGLKSPAALALYEEGGADDVDVMESENKRDIESLVRPVQAVLTPMQGHNVKAEAQKWQSIVSEADGPRKPAAKSARNISPVAVAGTNTDQQQSDEQPRSRRISQNSSSNKVKSGLRGSQKNAAQTPAVAAKGKVLTRAQKCKKAHPEAAFSATK